MTEVEKQGELPAMAKWLRRLLIIEMSVAAVCYVIFTWHWMLIWDAPIMHYVNFLMAHGMRPYSQITDNNMPGAYLMEWFGMHIFGPGDLGWRLYEFFLLGTLTAAMVVVAIPYDWVAGVFAGGMFLLMHGIEGPWSAAERDMVMSTLMMVGYAAMFTSVRLRAPAWMLAMGFCTAFAASIKPTVAPLAPLLALLVCYVLKKRSVPWLSYLLLGLSGMVLATALNVGFLIEHHAVFDFFRTQRTITAYYAALSRLPFWQMVSALQQPRAFLVLPVIGVALAVSRRNWTWEKWSLTLGAAFGLLSYLQQGKGFYYHRYIFFIFLLVLIGMELMQALRRNGWPRWFSIATLAYCMFVIAPHDLAVTHRMKGNSDLTLQLEADLDRLAKKGDLQRQVQCLDLVYGCFNALYHLQQVANSGFTGDLLIFDPKLSAPVQAHREKWWNLAQNDPANVLVVTNEWFQGPNGYEKLNQWPAYRDYVNRNYTLLIQRSFPYERSGGSPGIAAKPDDAFGYRIYVRNGSAFALTALDPA